MKLEIKAIFFIVVFIGLFSCDEKDVSSNWPKITDFAPKMGMVGSEVTLTGANFQYVDGVRIDEVSCEILSRTPNEIKIKILEGSVSGSFLLPHGNGKIEQSTNTFIVLQEFNTINFNPESGGIDDLVTIELPTPLEGSAKVKFGEVAAEVVKTEGRYITVKVPFGALSSRITISDDYRSATSSSEFEVLPGFWSPKSYFSVQDCASCYAFSIGTKGYVLNGPTKEFFEYIPTTDKWNRKADFPFAIKYGEGYSIGSTGYIFVPTIPSELWTPSSIFSYEPIADTWSPIEFPGTTRTDYVDKPTIITLGDKAYMFFYHGEVWEYTATTKKWLKKTTFHGAESALDGFAIGSNIYLAGSNINDKVTQVWQYNTISDQWIRKADIPVQRITPTAFSIGEKGFIGLGWYYEHRRNYRTDFLIYNQTSDTWTKISSYKGEGRVRLLNFVIGDKAYLGGGTRGNEPGNYKEMWMFEYK